MSSPTSIRRLAAAQYIGDHAIKLAAAGGPYYDASGAVITSLLLSPGDTLLLPIAEVYGQSILHDPRGIEAPLWLGYGRVVKPEHEGFPADILSAMGYAFDAGRGDFAPLADAAPVPPADEAPTAVAAVTLPLEYSAEEEAAAARLLGALLLGAEVTEEDAMAVLGATAGAATGATLTTTEDAPAEPAPEAPAAEAPAAPAETPAAEEPAEAPAVAEAAPQ